MSALKTTVVIVNWNGEVYLQELLRSIHGEKPSKIIVIDNNSTDNSLKILQNEPGVLLIRNNENRGFGAASNQGIAHANTQYIMVLNSDLRAVKGALEALENFLDHHQDAGAVAPKLLFPDGSLQLSCRKFPTLSTLFFYLSFLDRLFRNSYRLSAKDHSDTRIVEQPMGAAMMLRKKTLDEIGNFDESYFLYMEDVDLCERIVQKGWNIYYFPYAELIHDAGGSSRQDWLNSQKHFLRSALLYFHKKKYRMTSVRFVLALAFLIRSVVYLFAVEFRKAINSLRLSIQVLKISYPGSR